MRDGEYPGYFTPPPALPEDHTRFFSCWFEEACLTSIRGTEKYIQHYATSPTRSPSSQKTPLEQKNLVSERAKQEMALAMRRAARVTFERRGAQHRITAELSTSRRVPKRHARRATLPQAGRLLARRGGPSKPVSAV